APRTRRPQGRVPNCAASRSTRLSLRLEPPHDARFPEFHATRGQGQLDGSAGGLFPGSGSARGLTIRSVSKYPLWRSETDRRRRRRGRLDGRAAVVTGGGRGIGRGHCLHLAEQGASVVVCDVDADEARKVVEEIAAKGGKAVV